MTPQIFFEKIKTYKNKAHALLEDKLHHNITRGMGHSISGYVEDLFSVFVASNINRGHMVYFVDKVISFLPAKARKAKSIKPDLLVVENNVAIHYCDMKTDLGFRRDMESYLRERNDLIEEIKGREAWISFPGNKVNIKFSNEIKYRVVVVFGWNINAALLNQNIAIAESLPNVELYVLFKPREKGNLSTEDNVTISHDDFNRLSKALNFNP